MYLKTVVFIMLLALGFVVQAVPQNLLQPDLFKTCTDSSCILCPELNDPIHYQEGVMKALSKLVGGKDYTLIRTEIDLEERFEISPRQAIQFKKITQTFKDSGINIVIMFQPTRGMMMPYNVQKSDNYSDTKAKQSLLKLASYLRSLGFYVPDISELLNNPPPDYFFKRDHHWTPHGAKFTAEVMAKQIREYDFFKTLEKTAYKSEQTHNVQKDGTLNRGLKHICEHNFAQQVVQGYKTYLDLSSDSNDLGDALFGESDDESSSSDSMASALFGDAESNSDESGDKTDIILIGTSNSAKRDDDNKNYNFGGFLRENLQIDLTNQAILGGKAFSGIINYLLLNHENPPKDTIILWEFPATFINDDELPFRQLLPAIYGTCKQQDALLHNQLTNVAITDRNRIELLSNTGRNKKAIKPSDTYIQLRFSDTKFKDFYVITYFEDGSRDKYRINRADSVNNEYYLISTTDIDVTSNKNISAIFLEPEKNLPEEAIDIEVNLCLY